MRETKKRSLAKAIVWRILATLTTITIVFLFTGELILSIGVGAVEVTLKFILYYFHERMWGLIDWGRISYKINKGKKKT